MEFAALLVAMARIGPATPLPVRDARITSGHDDFFGAGWV